MTKTFVFLEVERVVLRKGAWLPRSFTLNALVPRLRDGAAAGYLRSRRLLTSSSEKPIHLRLRLARDTRATTAVAAAVSAATIQNEGVRDLWESFVSPVIFRSKTQPRSAALSTPKAFASHYRLNVINFRSLRRCVKASPAIASAPPIHVLGSGTGAAVTVSTMSLPVPPV